MGFALSVPTLNGFGGKGTFGHVMGMVEEITSFKWIESADSSFKWVESADLFEFLAKDLTGAFEQQDIGFAIGQEFGLEIEDIVGIVVRLPSLEFSGSFDRHAFGIVVLFVW